MAKRNVVNRTKIVCTIGPACAAKSILGEMIQAGMDVARINFSHGSAESNLELLAAVREAANLEGVPVAIMQDLQGPKLRVGELSDEGEELAEGTIRVLRTGEAAAEKGIIPVPLERLHQEVRRGDRVLLNDGLIEGEVVGVDGRNISVRILLGGTLLAHQGLTVPSRTLSIESLTEKDRKDLVIGLKNNVDFVALSFVKTADDVRKLKELIAKELPRNMEAPAIVVKIEKYEAVENFDEILEEAEAVMIARGDLGLETSYSSVPVTQKKLIAKSILAAKPVITATHMLSSMTLRPRPSRAEASDVANAVIDHTDAVMLSEETATGRYPVRSVMTMAEIIENTEESPLDNLIPEKKSQGESVPLAMAGAAVTLAWQIGAKAIVVTTRSGYSARAVAKLRPEATVVAATSNNRVTNQLQLSWGVTPVTTDRSGDPAGMAKEAMAILAKQKVLGKGDKVVVISGLKQESGKYDSGLRVVEV